MDEEAWYSVTPEGIARHLARFIASHCQGTTIVDAFCGVCDFFWVWLIQVGSNAIQFAKYFDKVIAIDIDPVKISCAKHNAKIYGVLDKIEFITGDFFEQVHRVQLLLGVILTLGGGCIYFASMGRALIQLARPIRHRKHETLLCVKPLLPSVLMEALKYSSTPKNPPTTSHYTSLRHPTPLNSQYQETQNSITYIPLVAARHYVHIMAVYAINPLLKDQL